MRPYRTWRILFNQQLHALPRQFRTLKFSKDKLRITAPIALTVKLTDASRNFLPVSRRAQTLNAYKRLVSATQDHHKLRAVYVATAGVAASIRQITMFSSQILIDKILPLGRLNLLVLFALGYVVFKLIG